MTLADKPSKPAAPAMSTARKLGLMAATSLVIGNMIGSGVFLLPSSLAPFGMLSLAGWVITSAGAILLALVFARLSQMVAGAGGPYAYTRAGFGDFAGFWIAWGYWIALWAGNAAIAVAFVGYLTAFIPGLTNHLFGGAAAIALVWLMTLINLRGVGLAGKVQTVTTVIKLLPLIAISLIGLFWFNGANPVSWTPTDALPTALNAVGAVVALTLWSFLGLESASVAGGEVENPTKTIPRATLLGTLVVAAVYLLSSAAVMGAVPGAQLAKSTFPFAEAARSMWGDWAFYAVAFCAAVSCLGALNGFILCTSQVSLAAAEDKLFPAPFARRSRTNVPAWGMIVVAILITILLAFNYSGSGSAVAIFNFIILLATLTTLVPYVFSTMAELILFFTDRERYSGKRLTGSIIIAVLAFVYSVYAIIGSGANTVLWGFILMLIGIPVYVMMRRAQAAAAPTA